LLTGERGHYALLAGEDALPYLEAMVEMSGTGGMIPEQIWDDAALPGLDFIPADPVDQPCRLPGLTPNSLNCWPRASWAAPLIGLRACGNAIMGYAMSEYAFWLPQMPISHMYQGNNLFIVLYYPGLIHSGRDGWQSPMDIVTIDSGLHFARIETTLLICGQKLDFTFQKSG
jgi:glucoamylase